MTTVPTKETEERSEPDSEPLRVLVLNKRCWHHPRSGGAEINLRETLTRLSKKGHEVVLLTAGYPGSDPKVEDDGVTINRVGTDFGLPQPFDTILAYAIVTIYFHYFQTRQKFDVVYYAFSPLPWFVLTGSPSVAIFHHIGIDSVFETHSFPLNWLAHFGYRLGIMYERDSLTVTVSESTTDILVDYGHDRDTIREVQNGIEIENFEPTTGAAEPRILFLGGLEKYKGADRIPDIHRHIEEQLGQSVTLDIAGRPGGQQEILEAYCSSTDSATFHGYVSVEQKVTLLQEAWIFIAPSRIEGWGIAVIEANACGTPAVGSNVEGLRDSIRDGTTGLLADGGDPAEFGGAVVELLRDEARRVEMGETAREWAERFTWERAADELEEALYEAVEQSSTRDY